MKFEEEPFSAAETTPVAVFLADSSSRQIVPRRFELTIENKRTSWYDGCRDAGKRAPDRDAGKRAPESLRAGCRPFVRGERGFHARARLSAGSLRAVFGRRARLPRVRNSRRDDRSRAGSSPAGVAEKRVWAPPFYHPFAPLPPPFYRTPRALSPWPRPPSPPCFGPVRHTFTTLFRASLPHSYHTVSTGTPTAIVARSPTCLGKPTRSRSEGNDPHESQKSHCFRDDRHRRITASVSLKRKGLPFPSVETGVFRRTAFPGRLEPRKTTAWKGRPMPINKRKTQARSSQDEGEGRGDANRILVRTGGASGGGRRPG